MEFTTKAIIIKCYHALKALEKVPRKVFHFGFFICIKTDKNLTQSGVDDGARTHDPQNHNLML
jgi:hypothetical protein